jgi:hypothetical protein
VSPVKYELGSYIPADDILHSDRRENLRSDILTGITARVLGPSVLIPDGRLGGGGCDLLFGSRGLRHRPRAPKRHVRGPNPGGTNACRPLLVEPRRTSLEQGRHRSLSGSHRSTTAATATHHNPALRSRVRRGSGRHAVLYLVEELR